MIQMAAIKQQEYRMKASEKMDEHETVRKSTRTQPGVQEQTILDDG